MIVEKLLALGRLGTVAVLDLSQRSNSMWWKITLIIILANCGTEPNDVEIKTTECRVDALAVFSANTIYSDIITDPLQLGQLLETVCPK